MMKLLWSALCLPLVWACAPAMGEHQLRSRLMIHVSPMSPTVMAMAGSGGVVATVSVGAFAGASLTCAWIHVFVDKEPFGAQDPDCDPALVDEDGGLWSRQYLLGPGTHTILVEAGEPGRKTVSLYREITVI